ncbi:hypothetical protein FDECE_16097 [Fusarium decemcellulare]|nr:hypothetical protein FDECE_16097 [Fusarium decemcellulare]
MAGARATTVSALLRHVSGTSFRPIHGSLGSSLLDASSAESYRGEARVLVHAPWPPSASDDAVECGIGALEAEELVQLENGYVQDCTVPTLTLMIAISPQRLAGQVSLRQCQQRQTFHVHGIEAFEALWNLRLEFEVKSCRAFRVSSPWPLEKPSTPQSVGVSGGIRGRDTYHAGHAGDRQPLSLNPRRTTRPWGYSPAAWGRVARTAVPFILFRWVTLCLVLGVKCFVLAIASCQTQNVPRRL